MAAATRLAAVAAACVAGGAVLAGPPGFSVVEMDEAAIRDRVEGAWLGQMIGVSWGFPTEFYARYIWEQFPELHAREDGPPRNIYAEFEGGPIPLELLPSWRPEMINGGYTQDDLYVEVPFIEALTEHGVNAGWGRLGEAFARTEFPLWHANAMGRENLRNGIAPPLSGHYASGGESDDLDWQIEADFVGLMNPGQPHSAAEIAFRAGHVMCYGDGVYGGVFVATMIAEAFTAGSVREAAEAGRAAVPGGTLYRAVLDQVFERFDAGVSYDDNLAALYRDWGDKDRCREWGGAADPLNIDAKLNGAFILLGLLYGGGDLAETMRLSMAAGQDSDCNPSNAGSVLGALLGRRGIEADGDRWLSGLDETLRFQTTRHTLGELIDLNMELARGVVELKGGSAPRGGVWRVPVADRREPLLFEQWPQTPNAAPVLTASVEVGPGRAVRVRADGADADGVRGYWWSFGDLSYASGPAHQHAYRSAGTYELVAGVADETGNTSYAVIRVTVP